MCIRDRSPGVCVWSPCLDHTPATHTNHTVPAFTRHPQCIAACGWYSLHSPMRGWPGWVDMGDWSHTEINVAHRELNPHMVRHPSTNRARCRLTSLMETNVLPLCQTTTVFMLVRCAFQGSWDTGSTALLMDPAVSVATGIKVYNCGSVACYYYYIIFFALVLHSQCFKISKSKYYYYYYVTALPIFFFCPSLPFLPE